MTAVGWSVLVACLVVSSLPALLAIRKNKTADDYFFAGRNAAWWMVGISLSANALCGADLAAIPGWVFFKDLRFSAAFILSPLLVVVYSVIWMPLWRRLRGYTVFEYLEARFNPVVRGLCAGIFVLGGLVILASPVYMTSLFISHFTGFEFLWIVVAVVSLLGLYSVLGGARADIYTDVLQLLIFGSGVVYAVVRSVTAAGGLAMVWQTASRSVSGITGLAQTTLVSTQFSFTAEASIWALIAFYVQVSLFFGINQMAVQRVECTSSPLGQRRALWLMTGLNMIFIAVLAVLGLSLVAYRQINPSFASGLGPDSVLPRYASLVFPEAVKGLFLAALALATVSTVDSGLNSYSNVILNDLVRWRPLRQTRGVGAPRWTVAGLCVATMTLALLLNEGPSASLIEKIGQATSMLGAPVTAIFLAGLFMPRASAGAAVVGMVLGAAGLGIVSQTTQVSWMWYYVIGLILSLACIGLLSIVMPARADKRSYTWRNLVRPQ